MLSAFLLPLPPSLFNHPLGKNPEGAAYNIFPALSRKKRKESLIRKSLHVLFLVPCRSNQSGSGFFPSANSRVFITILTSFQPGDSWLADLLICFLLLLHAQLLYELHLLLPSLTAKKLAQRRCSIYISFRYG